jgi:tripartite-type tricarboxylate transporter receptor subunit TctC
MNIERRTLAALGACIVAAWAVPGAAWAQQYPDRTITMIVPFPPGGVADTVARPLAEALGRELGQSVIVENKGGAGGALGIGHAARAPADGYTVLLSLSSISVLPQADRILGRKPSYQMDQFKPIARITADPTVFVVRADAPWKTLKEFIADAKGKPGAYNYGSSGNYGTMHVPMEMLKNKAGFSMTHIPFTGAGPAVNALLGGQVDALSSGPASIQQHVKAGKLRALAHWGEGRLTSLPDVPSLRDLGFDVQYAQWSGLFVPAGTPQPVVDRLSAAMDKLAAEPAFQKMILATGSPLAYQDAEEFARYWSRDVQTMTQVVQRIGRVE